jgi:hypothetical protein
MKKDDVKIGSNYLAKVSEKVVTIRIDAESRHGGWDATNLATGKKVRIKSAQRLRGPATDRSEAPAAAEPDRVPLNPMNTPSQPKAKKRSGLDTAYELLKTSGEPMRCKDLVDKMIADGLWHTAGKTPSATIYSAIIREIAEKRDDARFRKTDRGMFTAA